jgi:hypothetical protein|tara:strand:- start:3279 stop:4613 length:1335 start_codon:yes stop_codon:yes gene_type:complete
MSRRQADNNKVDIEISLVNFDDSKSMDIKPLVAEVSVYYDLFNSVIKTDMLISDGVGLVERFPIVGDEKIVLRMKSVNEKRAKTFIFDVYKLSNRAILEERQHGYVLHGMSRHGIQDTMENVDIAFQDTPISDIVTKVFESHLSAAGEKSVEVEATEGTFSVVGTGQSPTQFINMLGKEAQSTQYKDTSTFLFYEDNEKFHFKTLSSLFSGEPVEKYYLSDPSDSKLKDGKGSVKPYQSIMGLSFNEGFNTLDGMINGVYKNNVEVIDPILRKFESIDFSYLDDFDKLTHMGGKKYLSTSGAISKGKKSIHSRLLISQISDKDYKTESYLNGKTGGDILLNAPRLRHKFLNQSISEQYNMGQHTIDLSVSGNTNLEVGQIISVFIPQPSDVDDDKQKFIKLYGQKASFLITAMKHTYKAADDMFITVMSCVKESFGAEIKYDFK